MVGFCDAGLAAARVRQNERGPSRVLMFSVSRRATVLFHDPSHHLPACFLNSLRLPPQYVSICIAMPVFAAHVLAAHGKRMQCCSPNQLICPLDHRTAPLHRTYGVTCAKHLIVSRTSVGTVRSGASCVLRPVPVCAGLHLSSCSGMFGSVLRAASPPFSYAVLWGAMRPTQMLISLAVYDIGRLWFRQTRCLAVMPIRDMT